MTGSVWNVLYLVFQQTHRWKDVEFDFTAINLPPRFVTKRSLPILSSISIVSRHPFGYGACPFGSSGVGIPKWHPISIASPPVTTITSVPLTVPANINAPPLCALCLSFTLPLHVTTVTLPPPAHYSRLRRLMHHRHHRPSSPPISFGAASRAGAVPPYTVSIQFIIVLA
ncbi:hypothetical protein FB451DRAFT_1398155 [Mycena latifolia]|nr:hypothetical protein FB451DRAFT_1398155 [Mycena latifolia]